MTDEERRIDRIKMATWPLVLAVLYGAFMDIEWTSRPFGRMMSSAQDVMRWLLVEPFGFWGSIALVAGVGYFLIGFLLVGNDPHAEREY